ncbi:dithiol-glutaredoxin protein [Nitzschia inconspicua]|uniref:Dithiol-glutaredoxin protein n=1 Tax=Nitzschia inconspicua TaxID=303405 RepID=A0A9K3Q3C8_9STRA|nr:dithiol-glutaredoxin protein [Nitzschia inconspicua]
MCDPRTTAPKGLSRRVVSTVALGVLALLASMPVIDAFVRPGLITLGKCHITSSPSSSSSTQVGLMNFLNDGKKALVKSLAGEYDATAIQTRINGLIDDNPVLMFSFTTCPFCIKAKQVLDDLGAKYTVIELDTDPDGKAIRAEMADFVGRTSVPAIWIAGQFVGGCNDGPMGGLVKLNDSGKLDGMLREVGAL